MRGRKRSSAKRVLPVTFARASTLRRGTPITRNASPLVVVAPVGVFRKSFSFGMRPPECLSMLTSRNLRCRAFPARDLKHRGFDAFKNLQIPRTPAQISGDCVAKLISRGTRLLIQHSLPGYQT